MLTKSQKAVLYMTGSVVCFSTMDLIVKYLNNVPFGQVLFMRFFFGMIPILFLIPRDKIFTFYKTKRPILHTFRAVSGTIAIIALFVGLRNLPLTDVISLTFTGPLFVTIMSVIFLSEKVGVRRWSAVIIGFVGSLIVIRPGFMELNLATIAALGTGFFYGIYLVITRKLHTSDSPLLTLLLTGVVGAVIASFLVPVVWISPTFNQWSLLALMGIFACLGHLFLILSLKYADASKLAPFGYFEIVTNVILGYYFFGDFPHYWTWIGLAIIVCSGIYISLRERASVLVK